MEYQKTNVNAFLGLDNNSRPELIKDQEASDIENLRFEKLGYLINRNGVQLEGIDQKRDSILADFNGILRGIGAMGISEYVITKPWGFGSGVPAWEPYDDNTIDNFSPNPDPILNPTYPRFTDRFMVYSLRLPSGWGKNVMTDWCNQYPMVPSTGALDNSINRYTWRYKAAYLLVPLMGPNTFKDEFAFAPNGFPLDATSNYAPKDLSLPILLTTVGSRSIVRADDKPSKLQIYAPSRWLGVHNTFAENDTPKDLNWIEHYVTMNQYRDAMVISDMTNGDMLLVDEYSEAEYDEERKHRFTMRENALAKFDVDDVVIDFGIGNNNFNDKGIKSPMALYKFYLQRSRFQATSDNFAPYYTAYDDRSPQIQAYSGDVSNWEIYTAKTTSFIAGEYWYGLIDKPAPQGDQEIVVNGIKLNVDTQYLFTSNAAEEEYDDLFSTLTLNNPDIKTSEPQVSSDIYLWKDLEVTYYPASGSILNSYCLTAKDRLWDKTSSAGTKLIKLTTKTNVEQDVPLGVWRYRFVWYLGNGEYSAPSAELVVPDLLFSGIKDADIVAALGSYQRPFGAQSFSDMERTSLHLSTTNFLNNTARMQGPLVFDSQGNQTSYGINFIAVKTALYQPSHVFAAKKSTTLGASWPTNWNTESTLAKGQVCTTTTMFWQTDSAELAGVTGEFASSRIKASTGSLLSLAFGVNDWVLQSTDTYTSFTLSLRIPIFALHGTNSSSYNSVFSDYGVLRTTYQNVARNSASPYYTNNSPTNNYPGYEIVLEGKHRYGAENYEPNANENRGWLSNDVINDGKSIWFNIVPFTGGTPSYTNPAITVENNNQEDDTIVTGGTPPANYYLYQFRNMTVLRGVKEQSERLLYTKSGVPTEVISRMVLPGTGEIPLCDYGDWGGLTFQNRIDLTVSQSDRLTHQITRSFTIANAGSFFNVDTTDWPGSSTYTNFVYASNLNTTGSNKIKFNNLKVVLSGSGERLTIPEQLSMYIPASLLFDAPHVKLVIPANRVPRRARQLLIFRTRASHDNAWQPHEYGLVKSVDLIRDKSTWKLAGDHETEVKFLDDVKSSELDYSYSIPDYDGFVEPIKSRFCLPLNERVFYANIKEGYKPHSPRNSVRIETIDPADTTVSPHRNKNYGSDPSLIRLWSHKIFTPAQYNPGGTAALTSNIQGRYLYYFVAYNDQARSFSLAGFSGLVDRLDGYNRPVLFGLPSAYDPAVEQLNVYRLGLGSPLQTVPFSTTTIDGSNVRYRSTNLIAGGSIYYVAQGLVEYNGVVYYPNSVIQSVDAGDTGLVYGTANRMLSYFWTGDPNSNRGNASTYCQPIVYDISDHFEQQSIVAPPNTPPTGPFIEKIGIIKPEDEGIFYDEDLPPIGRLPIKQLFQNEDTMPSALRWSEPYQPNKLKLGSLMEVRAGDGDQITGMAMLYGNLIILKERSIHRLAVQGSAVPVSRVDEISNNVGCIAPNTVITVNNTLYFLSWSGLYKYDNNVLSKIDGKFAEELQLRLRSAQNGVSNPAIRDASCGWNSAYRELYLNIPVMTTNTNEGDANNQNYGGITISDNKGTRQVRGHIYAINMDTGLVTKHRYMDDSVYFTDPLTWQQKLYDLPPTQRAPRTYSRLYYTNSLGQMRSAEILPPRTTNYLRTSPYAASIASIDFMRSSMFIESPTKDAQNRDKSNDDYLTWIADPIAVSLIVATTKFIRIFWSSKDWTAEDKSVLKRIRKVFAYISASDDPVILRGVVHTSPMGATATLDTAWQYNYVDSRPASPRLGYSVTGEIMAVPTESAGSSSSPSQNRGERHTFNVEGSGAFQMEYFGFYWKPINQYER